MITAMAAKHDRVPPLLRAFGLLEHVASADGPVALQELAADAGLPKPTVYRMLAMLESAGYTVVRIHPYDFFPLTHHVEALALLDLRA